MFGTAAAARERPATTETAVVTAALRTIGSALQGFVRWLDAAHTRSRSMRALSRLDDYALKDIGLHRSQIDSIDSNPRYVARYTHI